MRGGFRHRYRPSLVSGNGRSAGRLCKRPAGFRNVFNIKRLPVAATRRAWARKSIPIYIYTHVYIYFVGPRARSRTTFLSRWRPGRPADKLMPTYAHYAHRGEHEQLSNTRNRWERRGSVTIGIDGGACTYPGHATYFEISDALSSLRPSRNTFQTAAMKGRWEGCTRLAGTSTFSRMQRLRNA